ncbi:MAG: HAD-IB family hydrolase [Actinomycetota bacterium]
MIRESLAGKRIALTGVTGFLGQGLLERLVHDVPVERIDVFIRGDAQARLEAVLAGAAFAPLRAKIGDDGLRERAERLITPHSADLVTDTIAIPSDVDIVVHSAATVSFDAPIDEAFDVNLHASLKVLAAGHGARHIHVSTAYVAGMTRGTQAEEPIGRDVDWRAEADFARRVRSDAEDASRRPEVLAKLIARARHGVGRAGPQSVAARAESLRREWVRDRLIAHGSARAHSLGWPDVYTLTKGLTEMAIAETRGDTPVAIVRPSIIESALRHPYPGWIEGFRVTDPVIVAYGRNVLPEFPGVPEGVLDLIPVDFVVNCILAVAAAQPEPLGFYHCSSGTRNPLRFREMYENCREYFQTHPLPERNRGAFLVPEWSFPGKRVVHKRIRQAEQMVSLAERGVERIPRGSLARKTARRVDRLRAQVDFVKRYANLYGGYTEAEVIYTDERAAGLHGSLSVQDQQDFGFDPTVFTWREYLQGIHNPSITALMRMPRPAREEPRVTIAPANGGGNGNGDTSGPSGVLAVFDVEGTIVASNVVEAFVWLRLNDAPRREWRAAIWQLARRLPGLLSAERRDRGEFLRGFYRGYAGVRVADLHRLAHEAMPEMILRRLSPAATRRIREHRAAGHRVVLVTGAAEFVVDPLRPLVDDIVAAELRAKNGRYTGDLSQPPLVGEARASWLRAYATAHGADLSRSYAYADSMSDLPMLQVVGNPVAVNPDVTLTRIARASRWPIEEWPAAGGTPKLMIPESVG